METNLPDHEPRASRAEDLFERVLKHAPDERSAYLDQACAGDAGLRARVEALVRADAAAGGFLQQPIIDADSAAHLLEVEQGEPDTLPESIGPFRVLELIGHGGMGVVYRARQDQPARDVAVKVLHPTLASRSALRRFEREGEILARLAHPGISRVYQTGFTDTLSGRLPYLSMELVTGRPLTRYAADRELSLRARLAIFARVCDAVHHAHAKGVIHRDLKPANILVSEDDRGEPAPKVLDFGIARLVDPDASLSRATASGELLGTPAYMSPEQAVGDQDAVDIRADVYALGVILHELLCGTIPFDCEPDDTGGLLAILRDSRSFSPSISRSLPDDLRAVIGKALTRDPERRYGSAAELGEEVRRFLRHEPVVAQPISALSKAHKFARRNPILVGSSLLVFVILIASAAIMAVMWSQAVREEEDAQQQAGNARELEAILRLSFGPAREDQERGRSFTIREALEHASRELDERAPNLTPETEVYCRRILGETCWHLQLYGEAERHLLRAMELVDESVPLGSLDEAQLRNWLANVLRDRKRFDEAEQLYAEVAAYARENVSDPTARATIYTNHALALLDTDRPDEAVTLFEEALDLRRSIDPKSMPVVSALGQLVNGLRKAGRLQEGGARGQEALQLAVEIEGPDGPGQIDVLRMLTWLERDRNDLDRAASYSQREIDVAEAAFGADHPFVGIALINLSDVQKMAEDSVGRENSLRRATSILRAHESSSPVELLEAIERLIEVLGDKPEATVEVSELELEVAELRQRVGLPDKGGS